MEHQQTADERFVFKFEGPVETYEMGKEENKNGMKIIRSSGDKNKMTLGEYFAKFNPDTDDPDICYVASKGTETPDGSAFKEYTLPEDVSMEWSAIVEINLCSEADSHIFGNKGTQECFSNDQLQKGTSVRRRKHKREKKTTGKETKKPHLEVMEFSEDTEHSESKNKDQVASSTRTGNRKKTGVSKKIFECDRSQHVSRSFSDTKSHAVKHTGDKPYSCHVCDYTTGWAGSLRRHVRGHGKMKSTELEKQAARQVKELPCELKKQAAEQVKEQSCELEKQPVKRLNELEQQAAKKVKEQSSKLENQAAKQVKEQPCEIEEQVKEQPFKLKKQATKRLKQAAKQVEEPSSSELEQPAKTATCPFTIAWSNTLGSKVKFRVCEGSRKRSC